MALTLLSASAQAAPGCPMPGTSYGAYPAPLYPDPALYPHPVHGVPGSGGWGRPGYTVPLGTPMHPGGYAVYGSGPGGHAPHRTQPAQAARPAAPPAKPAARPSAAPAEAATKAASVTIANMRFGAGEVTIKAGESVTWSQSENMPHTVTGEGWGSGTLSRGQTFTQVFDKPGRYAYTCRFHPNMNGVVIVE